MLYFVPAIYPIVPIGIRSGANQAKAILQNSWEGRSSQYGSYPPQEMNRTAKCAIVAAFAFKMITWAALATTIIAAMCSADTFTMAAGIVFGSAYLISGVAYYTFKYQEEKASRNANSSIPTTSTYHGQPLSYGNPDKKK